ncbi:MAG: N-acyl-D-amino-acid deacylase family protein [Ilumatobacteraceae bacterium]
MADFDLIVRGGTLIDGTGAPPRTADVAVRDGVIAAVGQIDGAATREVDADGLLVTPGFVDIHAHYDGQATWDERLTPSSWHGVTTVVAGNCGVGFAPVRPSDHDQLIELMEGVEDIPGVALHEGLPWTWRSFPEFLDHLDGRHYDIDLAVQVPHAAVRLHVMGQRGADRETATPDEIARMAAIVREGVEAGALGFTTSRTINHKTSRGEPTPTLTAAADELVGIAMALGTANAGVLQVVTDFFDVDDEFGLLRRMTAESGRPLSFSLVEARSGSHHRLLEELDHARADGLDITAQVATRAIGVLLGLHCTLHPLLTNPVHREISALPTGEQARIMRDPGFKQRVLEAVDPNARRSLITIFEMMYELGDPPDYEPDPSTSLAARAAREGRAPIELAYEILAAGDGQAFIYFPTLNYADGNLDAVGEMLAHDHTVPGLADGGAHVGTICDASFPTTLLAHWGRDRPSGRLPLPYLVQRHTRDTARAVGLLDRGVVAPGYRGDLNVIDFDALSLARPEMRHDLPAGGKRLIQRASGYVATVVAGTVTYENGEAAGTLPGRLVRGAQPAPSTIGVDA